MLTLYAFLLLAPFFISKQTDGKILNYYIFYKLIYN